MSIDKDKLKALAEAATPTKWSTSGSYIAPTRQENGSTYVESWRSIALVSDDKDRAFIAAANPATILALIAEIERLQREEKNDLIAYMSAIERQEELRAERDQLKSEKEDLSKDLESHKRMLLSAACAIGAIGEALGADMDDDGSEIEGMAAELRKEKPHD